MINDKHTMNDYDEAVTDEKQKLKIKIFTRLRNGLQAFCSQKDLNSQLLINLTGWNDTQGERDDERL